MSGVAFSFDLRGSLVEMIDRLRQSVSENRILQSLAGEFENLTKDHLAKLGRERHHPFAPRSFYGEASAATSAAPRGGDVVITIRQQIGRAHV